MTWDTIGYVMLLLVLERKCRNGSIGYLWLVAVKAIIYIELFCSSMFFVTSIDNTEHAEYIRYSHDKGKMITEGKNAAARPATPKTLPDQGE